ncbi:MAG: hypothetical protein H6R00_2149 [Proteobacteria bacterium]|nr:hypothetical protein [Pseudomonadota bacterium]
MAPGFAWMVKRAASWLAAFLAKEGGGADMDVVLDVDMQAGLREGPQKYGLLGVVGR